MMNLTHLEEEIMIEYILVGVLAPIFLNLLHMIVNIYIVLQRGNIMSLVFTGASFVTKTIGMVFLLWLGIHFLNLNFKIFVPLLSFFWLFTHFVEAFVIQDYMNRKTPKWLQKLQIK